jgi:hypothetical protein
MVKGSKETQIVKAFYRLITGKQRLPIRQNAHFPFTVTGKQTGCN